MDCKELWQIVTLCGVKELNLEGNDIGIDGLKHFKKLLQQRDLKDKFANHADMERRQVNRF